MGDYYNATRGPLSASLTDGSALSIGPKQWIFIHPEQESSSSIIMLLNKGFLVKAKVPKTIPAPAAPAAEVAVPAAAAEAAPAPSAPAATKTDGPASEASASTSSMKEEILKKKK